MVTLKRDKTLVLGINKLSNIQTQPLSDIFLVQQFSNILFSFQSSQPSSDSPSEPSSMPSKSLPSQPSSDPSMQPSSQPSEITSSQPSSDPPSEPSSMMPSKSPSLQPSSDPSSQPSSQPSYSRDCKTHTKVGRRWVLARPEMIGNISFKRRQNLLKGRDANLAKSSGDKSSPHRHCAWPQFNQRSKWYRRDFPIFTA